MKQIKNLLFLFLFSIVMSIAYSNCSKLPLEAVVPPKVEMASAKPETLNAQLCSELRPIVTPGSKFIFVIDMSASNFGNWVSKVVGGKTYSYWDPAQATDNNSDRIKAIEMFIDSCISQLGNRYAVVAFSKTAGVLALDAMNKPTLSCANPKFVTADDAKKELQKLREVQVNDRKWYEKWVNVYLSEAAPDSLIMVGTSYPQALTCATDLITHDLLHDPNSVSDFYHVFFMSDGKPVDRNDPDCKDNTRFPTDEDKQRCFYDKAVSSIQLIRTASLSQARDLRLYSVFYGASEVVPPVMNGMAASGGSEVAIELKSFAEDPKALCNVIVAKAYNEYTPDRVNAITLTTRSWQGEVLADSDMDGVPDVVEAKLGWDYQNARSLSAAGVLDGICYAIGGEAECKKRRATISVCDPLLFTGFNLNDCDLKMLNISGGKHTGVDTDFDGLTDYIEVIKGTNPSVNDSNQDADRDGKTNLEELLLGTDPNFFDNDFPKNKLNQISITLGPDLDSKDQLCKNHSATIDIEFLNGTPTQGLYSYNGIPSVLNHEPNEHKVMLFYQLNQESGLAPSKEQYYRVVDFEYSKLDGINTMKPKETSITQKSFGFLGRTAQ
jgi:hypothetical protein